MRLSNYLRLSVKKAFVPGARGGAAGLVDLLQWSNLIAGFPSSRLPRGSV